MTDCCLKMEDVHKTYRTFEREVVALAGASLLVRRGTVHGLLGENGAGKTTLMRILAGLETMDAGRIELFGRPVTIRSAAEAAQNGIGMVHQHFSLLDGFTVLENVTLGMEPVNALGFIRKQEARARFAQAAAQCGFAMDPDRRASALSMGERQQVEILRILYGRAELLIFDEPSSMLSERETGALLETVGRLRAQGKSILYISHKLGELRAVADEVTVLRGGRTVLSGRTDALGAQQTLRAAFGQASDAPVERPPQQPGAPLLTVRDLCVENGGQTAVTGAGFSVCAGEIVGVAGVGGSGQTALLEALFGLRRISGGQVLLGGQDITRLSVASRRSLGLGYIPEDRIRTGSCINAAVWENLLIDRLRPPLCRCGVLRMRAVRRAADALIGEYRIGAAGAQQPAGALSGGHIQRTVLARELSAAPRVLLAEGVTTGLDVKSAREARAHLLMLRQNGVGILLASGDLDELTALSDRVLVMRAGRIAASLYNDGPACRAEIGRAMLGAARPDGEAKRDAP